MAPVTRADTWALHPATIDSALRANTDAHNITVTRSMAEDAISDASAVVFRRFGRRRTGSGSIAITEIGTDVHVDVYGWRVL